jgi:hypothetical protein
MDEQFDVARKEIEDLGQSHEDDGSEDEVPTREPQDHAARLDLVGFCASIGVGVQAEEHEPHR